MPRCGDQLWPLTLPIRGVMQGDGVPCEPITTGPEAEAGIRLPGDVSQWCLIALQLVAYSFRKLHVDELLSAILTIHAGGCKHCSSSPLQCRVRSLRTADDLRSLCANFLVITEDRHAAFANPNLKALATSPGYETVYHAHGFGPHEAIATACIRQVVHFSLSAQSRSAGMLPEDLDLEPSSFTSYARSFWPRHCRCALSKSRYLTAAINLSFRAMMRRDSVKFLHDDDRSTDDEETRCLRLCAVYDLKLPARTFIEMGANINKECRDSRDSVLHVAVAHRSLDVARLLLQRGADVTGQARNCTLRSCECRRPESTLHAAVRSRNKATVKLLLENGADAHTSDAYDRTPLRLAVATGFKGAVQCLLDNQPDSKAVAGHLRDCIALASELNYSEIAQLLLDRYSILSQSWPAEDTPVGDSPSKPGTSQACCSELSHEALAGTLQPVGWGAVDNVSLNGVETDDTKWVLIDKSECL